MNHGLTNTVKALKKTRSTRPNEREALTDLILVLSMTCLLREGLCCLYAVSVRTVPWRVKEWSSNFSEHSSYNHVSAVVKCKCFPIVDTERLAQSWSWCTGSLQVSHPPGGRLPLLSAKPAVTSPATEHHCPLAGTKLYCLVTEAHRCKQLSQGCYAALPQVGFKPATYWSQSPTLYPLHYRTTSAVVSGSNWSSCVAFGGDKVEQLSQVLIEHDFNYLGKEYLTSGITG